MIIPPGFGQATFVFTGTILPRDAVCTLGVDLQGFPGDDADAAGALYLAWQNSFLGVQSMYLRLAQVDLKRGPNSTGPTTTHTGESVGSAGGSAVPAQVSALIEKNTALGGRQGRGRMYIPGLPDSGVDDTSRITGTILTGLQAACGDFVADLLAANLPPVLLHSNAVVPTDIVNLSVDPLAATQRRRLRR